MPENHDVIDALKGYFPEFAFGLFLMGVIYVGIAHLLRVRRDKYTEKAKLADEKRTERAQRTKEFMATIDPIISAINGQHSVKAVYINSRGELQSAVMAFAAVLEVGCRAGFIETWEAYKAIDNRLLEPEIVPRSDGQPGRIRDYSRGRNIVLPLLKKLRSYAKP